jgi:DNA-binding LacI/PurR family transcriptional regulator
MARHSQRPNQAYIAEKMGVSISTVSRALANEPGISEAVRIEVQKLARAVGYKTKHAPAAAGPDRRAVALVPLNRATGGLAGFYEDIVEGMRETALEADLNLDVRLVNEAFTTAGQLQRHMAQSEASSLMLVGIDPSEELAEWLAKEGIPLILVNGSDPGMRFSSVSPSNYYGARLATEHLLAAGHRRIVHVTYHNRHTIYQRTRGFEAAIAATPGAEGHILRIEQRTPSRMVSDLLKQEPGFTAVFCMNDLIAVDLMESVEMRKLDLPSDFSLMGFDDLTLARMTSPRLSTIHVDRVAIGRGAVRLLNHLLDGDHSVQQVEIGVKLVPGGTVHKLG